MGIKYYWTRFKIEWQSFLEYRADMFIYALNSVAGPIVGLAIWTTVTNSGVNLIYSRSDLVIYFLAVILTNTITGVWASYFLGENINNGNFSKTLLKPVSLIGEYIVNNIVEKIQKLSFTGIGVIVIGSLLVQVGYIDFKITSFSLLLFLLALGIGAIVNFMLDINIGLTTFWTHDNYFLTSLSSLARDFFSGRVIPIVFLPFLLKDTVILSPLRYVISFPAEVLLNKLSNQELMFGFITGMVWLVLMVLLYKITYKYGVKRYQGYGG